MRVTPIPTTLRLPSFVLDVKPTARPQNTPDFSPDVNSDVQETIHHRRPPPAPPAGTEHPKFPE